MPTENWESPSYAIGSSSGSRRVRTWTRTPNIKQLSEWDKPINLYTDFPGKEKLSYWDGTTETNYMGSTTHNYPPQWPITLDIARSRASIWYTNRVDAPAIQGKISSMQNSNLVKTLGKIADAKANLPVMYAEASKTSDLILNTANRIDRAYRALRRGRFREVARTLNLSPKTVHKNWLEYQYGWMPLLMEVKNSAEFLAQKEVGRPIRFTVLSRTEDVLINSNESVAYVPYGGSLADAYDYHTLEVKYRCRHKIWCEVTNPHLSELQQLGITNPALVAWELVPYSFVFDWFIQVGSWLQGLTALHGISVKKAMLENLTEVKYSFNRPGTARHAGGGWYYINSGWSHSSDFREYGRSSISVDPGALYPPAGTGIGSFSRLLSSLALLRGNARGLRV